MAQDEATSWAWTHPGNFNPLNLKALVEFHTYGHGIWTSHRAEWDLMFCVPVEAVWESGGLILLVLNTQLLQIYAWPSSCMTLRYSLLVWSLFSFFFLKWHSGREFIDQHNTCTYNMRTTWPFPQWRKHCKALNSELYILYALISF